MGLRRGLVVHLALFAFYAFTLTIDIIDVDIGWQGYGWRMKYLTFINLLLQTFYFGLSLLNDLTGSYVKPSDNGGRKSKLQSFLDVVLASLAYPIGVFVVMTFWAIYAVDRELVYPKVLDALIPQWLNHAMHTTVLPFLLIEQYVVFHDYPARSKGISILLAFGFAYLCWILWIAYYADLWVYPILQLMETHQRAIFFLVLLAFFITIYILGEVINKALWRKEYACKVQQKRKTKKIS
ncbi:androgen-induced gene 1 protein-like isoform X2 [Dreissena polymorpha]|uniref:androgen-induced gene 1 protein-like isoform X2 n=1 Tax=Dreissena polymorpha TaxID=45954 RepID=UPI0022652052|nr:androgen-induced gene 1 protein-like isoform X2 [Dreissena polymorpha]